MKTYKYHGTEVSLRRDSYRNGTTALVMETMDGEFYAVATVNLCHPLQSESMAFLDENNLPGIGKWIENNHLGVNMGVIATSGYCRYPLFTLY